MEETAEEDEGEEGEVAEPMQVVVRRREVGGGDVSRQGCMISRPSPSQRPARPLLGAPLSAFWIYPEPPRRGRP